MSGGLRGASLSGQTLTAISNGVLRIWSQDFQGVKDLKSALQRHQARVNPSSDEGVTAVLVTEGPAAPC